ncbi:MAG: peptidase family [Bacteroidota bacterium]|nr:peptidase family [Bacteroidota bacterium]
MKPTIKMLILLIAASVVYSLESFTSDPILAKQDSSMFKTREGETAYLESYNRALSLWQVKFEEVDLKTEFGKAHVIISGPERGSPLVLLHGMNASSTMWYPNIQALSKTHRVYAIDFIKEPGKSVLQKDIKNKEELIKWYSQVFDKLNLKHFSIIGVSRGGWIATQLALHSDKIDKLILISPAQTLTQVKPKKRVLKNFFYTLAPQKKQLRSNLQTLTADVDAIAPEWINQYYTCISEMKPDLEMLKMDVYSDTELSSLSMPVLVIIGDDDIINPPKSVERAKKMIPKVKTEILKDCGHFVTMDQKEKSNTLITEFLK